MAITSIFVVFATTWFIVFLCVLTWRYESQGDAGKVEPGTPASAPSGFVVGRKARWTTLITVVITFAICGTVTWSGLTIRDLDWMHTAVPLQR